jgi:hypothetical protein
MFVPGMVLAGSRNVIRVLFCCRAAIVTNCNGHVLGFNCWYLMTQFDFSDYTFLREKEY